jgi:hypothetical protein
MCGWCGEKGLDLRDYKKLRAVVELLAEFNCYCDRSESSTRADRYDSLGLFHMDTVDESMNI